MLRSIHWQACSVAHPWRDGQHVGQVLPCHALAHPERSHRLCSVSGMHSNTINKLPAGKGIDACQGMNAGPLLASSTHSAQAA